MKAVQRQSWLFNKLLFMQEVEHFTLSGARRKRIGKGLDRLRARWADKSMTRTARMNVTELRAQQAFNRLIFGEVLGYSDLLGDRLPYSLLPEASFGAARPDIAVGWFSPKTTEVLAVVELKSPGADLEKPQKGEQYRSKISLKQLSPVGQALEALNFARAEYKNTDWAIVSNMAELYLIHSSSESVALWVDLRILDAADYAAFYYAFGMGGFLSTSGVPRLQKLQKRAAAMKAQT